MFLCVYYLRRRDRHALARHVRATHDRDRDSQTMSAGCLLAGAVPTDAALAKLKESNLRFAMSEVSKLRPIAARRMDTAQAQPPFAISVNLVNDNAFDTQLRRTK